MDIAFINDAPPVVVGPWTDPFVARSPAGAKIVGVRLHPQESGVPEICTLRSTWRGMETSLRFG